MCRPRSAGRWPDWYRASWFRERSTRGIIGEVLVCLTRTGLIAHETIVAGALQRDQRLLEQLSKDEVAMLLGHIDRLTDTAAKMLDAEKDLSWEKLRASASGVLPGLSRRI